MKMSKNRYKTHEYIGFTFVGHNVTNQKKITETTQYDYNIK